MKYGKYIHGPVYFLNSTSTVAGYGGCDEVGNDCTDICGGLKGSLIEEPGTEHSPHHQVSAL